ncbi:MAG: SgcJ/EcaC family oxidoreductase [Devosia sp.]|nr:SgcJ/EcaC family oxidoreductase [Devosia sp.]
MKSDEDAIAAEIEAFSAAWNKGDAKLAASFFTEDGVRVGAMGDRQRGRADLEVAYHKLLHGAFAGARVRQESGSIRMLTPSLAVWQGGLEILPKGGAPMPGHVVQVMKKIDGRWLVLEAHPKLFPRTPRE